MATIRVYHQEDNRQYQVNIDLFATVVDRIAGDASDAETDYYLKLTTTIKQPDGTSYPAYVIRTLSDKPAAYPLRTTFTDLINDYVTYFLAASEYGQSSSSSSSSSESSSSSLDSSSSSSSSSVDSSSSSSESSSSSSSSNSSSSSSVDSSSSSSSNS